MNLSKALAPKKGVLVKRILGLSLMIFSALGLAISLSGLLAVSMVSNQVGQSADEALTLTLASLDTTSQSLDLVHSALGEAQDALGVMETVVRGTDDSLQNTGALIGSLSDFLIGDLSPAISNSQHSLTAAEEGAAVIEEMLYSLNAISMLTGMTYDPDVSLTESFARINQSLDTMPESLTEVDENLNAVRESLNSVQTDFTDLITTLNESEAILVEAQTGVDDYSNLVQELSLKISDVQENLSTWIRTAILSLYFLLIWLAISQIGLLWQGWEMVRYHPAQVEARVRELEEKLEELLQEATK